MVASSTACLLVAAAAVQAFVLPAGPVAGGIRAAGAGAAHVQQPAGWRRRQTIAHASATSTSINGLSEKEMDADFMSSLDEVIETTLENTQQSCQNTRVSCLLITYVNTSCQLVHKWQHVSQTQGTTPCNSCLARAPHHRILETLLQRQDS
jgi:hypothetical protein